jgi:hypothetical protein
MACSVVDRMVEDSRQREIKKTALLVHKQKMENEEIKKN